MRKMRCSVSLEKKLIEKNIKHMLCFLETKETNDNYFPTQMSYDQNFTSLTKSAYYCFSFKISAMVPPVKCMRTRACKTLVNFPECP